MPIGLVIVVTAAVFFGMRAREAHMAAQPYALLRRLPPALLAGIVGATADIMTGAAVMFMPDDYGPLAQAAVNVVYCALGLYLAVASYYQRVIPLRFTSR